MRRERSGKAKSSGRGALTSRAAGVEQRYRRISDNTTFIAQACAALLPVPRLRLLRNTRGSRNGIHELDDCAIELGAKDLVAKNLIDA